MRASDAPLCVFATIEPKPEYFADAKAAIVEILDPTRSEPGCHQFDLHEGLNDGRLYLYEQWESEAALAAHYEQAYTRGVFQRYEEWLAVPVQVTKMTLG